MGGSRPSDKGGGGGHPDPEISGGGGGGGGGGLQKIFFGPSGFTLVFGSVTAYVGAWIVETWFVVEA